MRRQNLQPVSDIGLFCSKNFCKMHSFDDKNVNECVLFFLFIEKVLFSLLVECFSLLSLGDKKSSVPCKLLMVSFYPHLFMQKLLVSIFNLNDTYNTHNNSNYQQNIKTNVLFRILSHVTKYF